MNRMLIIGYGNSLRADDGAGIAAVRRIAERYPGVHCKMVHQLGPELAEDIADYKTVVFLDASVEAKEVTVNRIPLPVSMGPMHTHIATAPGVLALAGRLYDASPLHAYIVHIPASSFEFGESCTPETIRHIEHSVESVGRLIDQYAGSPSMTKHHRQE